MADHNEPLLPILKLSQKPLNSRFVEVLSRLIQEKHLAAFGESLLQESTTDLARAPPLLRHRLFHECQRATPEDSTLGHGKRTGQHSQQGGFTHSVSSHQSDAVKVETQIQFFVENTITESCREIDCLQ